MHPHTRFKGDDDDLIYIATQLSEARSDSTHKAINIKAMAALEFSEVFSKARAEVECVCGVYGAAGLPVPEE